MYNYERSWLLNCVIHRRIWPYSSHDKSLEQHDDLLFPVVSC